MMRSVGTLTRADLAETINRKMGFSRAESLAMVEAILAQDVRCAGRRRERQDFRLRQLHPARQAGTDRPQSQDRGRSADHPAPGDDLPRQPEAQGPDRQLREPGRAGHAAFRRRQGRPRPCARSAKWRPRSASGSTFCATGSSSSRCSIRSSAAAGGAITGRRTCGWSQEIDRLVNARATRSRARARRSRAGRRRMPPPRPRLRQVPRARQGELLSRLLAIRGRLAQALDAA